MKAYNQNVQSVNDQKLLQEKEITALKLEQSQLNAKIVVTEALLSEGAIPAKELEDLKEQTALLELKLATANTKIDTFRLPSLAVQEIKTSIDAANQNINKQEIELTKYSIKSPIDGIVIDKKVQTGTFVQRGEVLLAIVSDNEKYAVVDIDSQCLHTFDFSHELRHNY